MDSHQSNFDTFKNYLISLNQMLDIQTGKRMISINQIMDIYKTYNDYRKIKINIGNPKYEVYRYSANKIQIF